MSVTIPGWTVTNAQAAEIAAAIGWQQGYGRDATAAEVRTLMANAVRQAVADYRRMLRDQNTPVDQTNPLE